MSGLFGQDKVSEKNTLQKDSSPTLANDSVDINGFRVSADEAKVYKEFLADREKYVSDEEMMVQYTKRVGMVRRRRDIQEKLAAAEKRIESKKQVIVAGGDRIESKKQDKKELEEDKKELEEDKKELEEDKKELEEDKKELEEDKKELIEENKQLKQQLFKAREKKIGRALTEKEKEEILKNIHSIQ